ncbi:hypothetical protein ACIRP7_36565 [Streptomyces sp. NPDC102270]|uniref:hypothetical protein n=1 Tax=Streptomyces sp. NPDC102270 TaxID=3366150 RepID=UPI0038291241
MLLRLTYLAVTNAFAMLRLLPTSDHGKDIEILGAPTWLRIGQASHEYEHAA